MANVDDRLPDNVPGPWYVDSNCIDCDVCRTTAPNNFKANEDEGYSYVAKQPENAEEEAQMEEAKASCPVEAIGNDGA
ncbi:MAG: ferredoxin [Thermoanaerobaculaceae bacterium]|nr:ferredoxin [Thermoanaerobaculaceae bacterium]